MITILGAGLSGISCSFHIGHNNCTIFEKNAYATGHIHSEIINGFTWDEGPHVSFTENEYVKQLFKESVQDELLEYPVTTVNYFNGNWIPHPAQSNLYAIPEPLRSDCLRDFLSKRNLLQGDYEPSNYMDWLSYSFGETFTNYFPAVYTRKYWTVDPEMLDTDWVGNRVFAPNIEQVKEGFWGPLKEQTHYIKKIRYPKNGGYMSFAKKILKEADIKLGYELSAIDFGKKKIEFTNGATINYERLINTLPLPVLISKSNAPEDVKQAAAMLNCSSVLLINVTANHATVRSENWIYIYDEEKYSTRINCTELLSPNNAPSGKSGIQVEVYFSPFKKQKDDFETIAVKVVQELLEMKLINSASDIETVQTKWVQWANVIFDRQRKKNQAIVFNWLEKFGLVREMDDLEPMTKWNEKFSETKMLGDFILAGRFGQWKYYWTDDCVLRGKFLAGK